MTKEKAKITFLNTLQDDNFIENVNEIFDELCDTYESRTCGNCKNGNEADVDVYFCTPMYNITGEIELRTPSSFGCNQWIKKENNV